MTNDTKQSFFEGLKGIKAGSRLGNISHQIQKYLEDGGFEIKSFSFERIPNDMKELTAEEQEDVEKLVNRLEEDDDVVNVFTNMK